MTTQFSVPTIEQVSDNNKAIFEKLQKGLGFVPNLYATFAYSNTALGDYLTLQNRKSSLSNKEKEVINLVVSQVNDCLYCLSAHTAIAKMNGFTDEQVLEIRTGEASFDAKLNALAVFVKDVSERRGKPSAGAVDAFLQAGYTKENIIDVVIIIGDKTITNLMHGITKVPIDFPVAPALEVANA